MYDICLIGYGVATLSTLLVLSKVEKPLNIIIFDPYLDGGNLRRRYGQVKSNTTWEQFINAITPYCPENLLQNLQQEHELDDLTTLNELVTSILKVVNHIITPNLRCESVHTIKESSNAWLINDSIQAKVVILNYGSIPKTLGFCKPTLPLDAVLNNNPLPCNAGDKIMIFGTLHSGVLCMNRLLNEGANIVAIYKGEKPFIYERDGAYNGLKNESAYIADGLINSSIIFINWNDKRSIKSHMESSDWLIYSCGFIPDNLHINVFNTNNQTLDITKYDSSTGKVCNKDNLFGFGIAYPNSNIVDGTKYYDVSFPAFIKHIEANKINILAYLEK